MIVASVNFDQIVKEFEKCTRRMGDICETRGLSDVEVRGHTKRALLGTTQWLGAGCEDEEFGFRPAQFQVCVGHQEGILRVTKSR